MLEWGWRCFLLCPTHSTIKWPYLFSPSEVRLRSWNSLVSSSRRIRFWFTSEHTFCLVDQRGKRKGRVQKRGGGCLLRWRMTWMRASISDVSLLHQSDSFEQRDTHLRSSFRISLVMTIVNNLNKYLELTEVVKWCRRICERIIRRDFVATTNFYWTFAVSTDDTFYSAGKSVSGTFPWWFKKHLDFPLLNIPKNHLTFVTKPTALNFIATHFCGSNKERYCCALSPVIRFN